MVSLDLETTGTWIEKDKIIEIAMIKCCPDGTTHLLEKKVNPGLPIPAAISALTGLTDDDVKTAPVFADIAQDVLHFIQDCDIAGFNVARFDLPLLRREVHEAGLKFDWENIKVYDAQRVYHLNERRDLTAAYNYYCHKKLDKAHSALADARATLEILQAQISRYGEGDDVLDSLSRFQYEQTAEFVDEGRKFRWWNGKAYMMFGKYAKKHSLQEVARIDPGYLEWILSAKFSEDVKALVANALQGRFPIGELKDKEVTNEI